MFGTVSFPCAWQRCGMVFERFEDLLRHKEQAHALGCVWRVPNSIHLGQLQPPFFQLPMVPGVVASFPYMLSRTPSLSSSSSSSVPVAFPPYPALARPFPFSSPLYVSGEVTERNQSSDTKRRGRRPANHPAPADTAVTGSNSPQSAPKKRGRQPTEGLVRPYACTFHDCDKKYDTLSHLNEHITLKKHGARKVPSDFGELRHRLRHEKNIQLRDELLGNYMARSSEAAAIAAMPTLPAIPALDVIEPHQSSADFSLHATSLDPEQQQHQEEDDEETMEASTEPQEKELGGNFETTSPDSNS